MTIEEVIKSSVVLHPMERSVLNIIYSGYLVEERLSEKLKPYGLSIQQYNVLRILRGQKGNPINLFGIQERMISKMSNTTRLVDKLVFKDWAHRQVCPENKRKVEITITEEGLKVLDELDVLVKMTHLEILKNLSFQELDTLNGILDKLK